MIFGKGWATPLGQRTTQGSEKNFFSGVPFFCHFLHRQGGIEDLLLTH